MATVATRRKSRRKPPANREKSPAQLAVAEAGRITGQIIAHMKNITRGYLQVGELLVRVREQKLYERLDLVKKDLETFAKAKLGMERPSLYKYIAAYEWAKTNHPEWLVPGYKGPLPDLNDVIDMRYIDAELAKGEISTRKRAQLEALRAKGVAGTLRRTEVNAVRRKTHGPKQALGAVIAKLQAVRRQASKLHSMPAEAMAHIVAAIEILQKQEGLRLAGLSFSRPIFAGLGMTFLV